ncbi:MAG: phage/plasmid primase, P4 family [Acidobacteria bacterium]|nr:phage/plasmid primase, P4 family [Acidobacteriota bacterium]
MDEQRVRQWWTARPTANIGIATGFHFFVLDVDVKGGGLDEFERLVLKHGSLPDTAQQITGTGGKHYLFRMPGFEVRNGAGLVAPGIDTRGVGGYIVAAPSIHPQTQREYEWDGMDPLDEQPIADAPDWLLDVLRSRPVPEAYKPSASPAETRIPTGKRNAALCSIAGAMRRKGLSRDEILAVLRVSNRTRCAEPLPESEIERIATSVARYKPDNRADVFRQLVDEEARAEAQPAEQTEEQVDPLSEMRAAIAAADLPAAYRLAPALAGQPWAEIAAIKAELQAACSGFSSRDFDRAISHASASTGISPPPPEVGEGVNGQDGPDLLGFPLTDSGNGERMVALYAQDVRYWVEAGKWLLWDNRRWEVDQAGAVKQMAKRMARLLYLQATSIPLEGLRKATEQWARKSESAAGINAALARFQTEDGIPVEAADLDQHPFLLNCLNGVLDLKKLDGNPLRKHDRKLLLTKLCHIAYDPQAVCPQFMAFIQRIMGQNPDAELSQRTARLISFLQRAFGYTLTGDTSAKVVFYFYGALGNNGKTTLLELFRHILSEYSTQLNIDTLLVKPGGESNATLADLADLRGARFVTTSEPEEGQRLRAGKLKYLSAGLGEIKSMRKWENPINFMAEHKIFIEANARLGVPANDQALWNRLKMVPFEVSIPLDEIDLKLPEKLRAEASGVLTWAVRGCASWLREGLGDCPEVVAEGAAWRAASDPLKDFLEDCCVLDDDAYAPVKEVSKTYEAWADNYGERYPLNRLKFNEAMRYRGLTQDKRGGVRCWIGLGLQVTL